MNNYYCQQHLNCNAQNIKIIIVVPGQGSTHM